MYQQRWRVSEVPPPKGGPSPQQPRGRGKRKWRAATTQDFLRNLRWRAQFGQLYAVVPCNGDQADILVPSVAPGEDRLVRMWLYPVLGLRAMRESGLLPMERVAFIPGFDVEAELYRGEGSRKWWGEDPEFWRLDVPDVATEQ